MRCHVEETQKEKETLLVFRSVTQNENVMKKGSDIKQDATVLGAGVVLGSREIGALAALGNAKVRVFKVPTVAVLSTGGEVTEPGKPLPPAQNLRHKRLQFVHGGSGMWRQCGLCRCGS
jgi:putative molybdopterin biosynthesis protein